MSSTIQKIAAARTALVLDHPFFGSLALKLKPVEDTNVTDTMATDGRSLFYAPDFVDKQTDAQLVGLLAHEVMHPAMQHHTRREHRDAKRWNIACDHAINPLLLAAGFTLPEGGLVDSRYEGMTAEAIFDALPQDPSEEGGGNGKPDANGQPQPGQQGVGNVPGAVLDAPDPSTDEAEWKLNVAQAAKVAEAMGSMPGHLGRAVKQANRAKADWRGALRRFVQQTAAADYSWSRPNPRYLAGGVYLPALRSEQMPAIVLAVDTSGSIDEKVLADFAGEMQSIVDEVSPSQVHVIYCDCKVQRVDTFERGEQITMDPAGGGGTRFTPVFDHVEAEGISPACVVYFTDGYGSYPELPPEYPVIWAMTSDKVAPFGETLPIVELA